MSPWLVGVGAAVTSAVLVGMVRQHALQAKLLDHPSDRSSHDRPTPRGGGLGVIIAALAGIIVGSGPLPAPFLGALAAVIVVAVVGWKDDRSSLPARTRILIHFFAGVGVAGFAMSTPGPLHVTGVVALGWWVFWSVSAINVTNFMDGIDGLIAGQMIVWGAHLLLLAGDAGTTAAIGAALAGACLGFLPWNWAPARIFLGDVGSGSLGILAVIGGIAAMGSSGWPLEAVFLPFLPLFLDAALTLLGRWRRGERLSEAHRQHLYQRLARSKWGHARVSLLFAVLALLGVAAAHLGSAGRPIVLAVYVGSVLCFWIWLERHVQQLTERAKQDVQVLD